MHKNVKMWHKETMKKIFMIWVLKQCGGCLVSSHLGRRARRVIQSFHCSVHDGESARSLDFRVTKIFSSSVKRSSKWINLCSVINVSVFYLIQKWSRYWMNIHHLTYLSTDGRFRLRMVWLSRFFIFMTVQKRFTFIWNQTLNLEFWAFLR